MSCEVDNCTRDYIHQYYDTCSCVKIACSTDYSVIDLFTFYYCDLNGKWYWFLPIGIILVLFLFDFISSTCENYLSPPLTRVGKAFHFSEALAGVTLIALANGGPDVVASFTAGSEPGGTFLAVGSLFGANLFTTTVVVLRCLLNTDEIIMPPQTIMRDLIFFIITVLVILSYGIVGEINQYMAIGYFGIYLCYITVVLIQERKLKSLGRESVDEGEKFSIQEVIVETNEDKIKMEEAKKIKIKSEKQAIIRSMMHEVEERVYSNTFQRPKTMNESFLPNPDRTQNTENLFVSSNDAEIVDVTKKSIIENVMRSKKNTLINETELFSLYARIFNKVDQQLTHMHNKWKSKTLFEKFYAIYEFPLNVVRDLTVPACSNKTYRKWKTVLYPITVITSLYFFFKVWNINVIPGIYCPLYLFSLPFEVGLSILLFFVAPKDRLPSYKMVFWLFAFINGIMWVYYIANVLMDVLQLIGLMTGIDTIILGLTILAWGNSANDFFVDASLAKAGYGVMAITGVFAGQLFNLFMGFGSNLLRQTLPLFWDPNAIPVDFSLFKNNPSEGITTQVRVVALVLIFGSLINLIFSLTYQILTKFVLKKRYGVILAIYYAVVFGGIVVYYTLSSIIIIESNKANQKIKEKQINQYTL